MLDWAKEADIVFMNCTTWDKSLMTKVVKKAVNMKEGTWFLTITNMMPTAEDKRFLPEERLWELVLSI
jgi:hypothetical protein